MDAKTKQSIIDIVRSCEVLQLCTFGLGEYPETRTVMNGLNRDVADLNLHFLTRKDSSKYGQIAANPHCCLYYFDPATRHSVRLFGLVSAMPMSAEFWSDEWRAFGYSGADDPNVVVLSFDAKIYKFYIGEKEFKGEI